MNIKLLTLFVVIGFFLAGGVLLIQRGLSQQQDTPRSESQQATIQKTTQQNAAPIPTPLPTATPAPQPSVTAPADLDPLFAKYAGEYGVNADELKKIAKCEASFNTQADTGLYAGMFQYSSETWINTRNAMGLDPNPDLRKNAEESIRTAAYTIKSGGRGAWPNC